MSELLVLRRFAHDSQCVLASVYRLALMRIKLLLDGGLGIPHLRVSGKLRVAAFADSEHWDVPDSLYDPRTAFWHEESLAHGERMA